MPLDKSPVFRKVVLPWYRSKVVCICMLIFMVLVFCFGLIGISVAREDAAYRPHLWLPIVLVVLSGGLMLSFGIRLIRRYWSK
jgi:hypothetical protein